MKYIRSFFLRYQALSSIGLLCLLAVTAACGTTDEHDSEANLMDQQLIIDPSASVQVVDQWPDGVPKFLRSNFGKLSSSLVGLSPTQVEPMMVPTLARIAPHFRLQVQNLHLRLIQRDRQGFTHLRYQQTREDRDVIGGELIVHLDDRGIIYAVNGTARGTDSADATPVLSAQTVARLVSRDLPALPLRMVYLLTEPNGHLHLVYELVIDDHKPNGESRHDIVYADTVTGRIVARHPKIQTVFAPNRGLYDAKKGVGLPGTLVRREGGAPIGDRHVDENYDHLGQVFNCLEVVFGRESIDDKGWPMVSTVHYDTSYNNAFWNGAQVVFGDGDGVMFGPFGEDFDIVAHELGHGVTDYTSGLVYQDESGALNESFSDITAAVCKTFRRGGVVDSKTWLLAETAYTPRVGGDALRYLNDPAKDGSSKDYYPSRYRGPFDYGGVHWNSGIPNLVFSLLVTGGLHPSGTTKVHVDAVGMYRAAQIWYSSFAFYMTSMTDMRGARLLTTQVAADQYRAAPWVSTAVQSAWDAVDVPR